MARPWPTTPRRNGKSAGYGCLSAGLDERFGPAAACAIMMGCDCRDRRDECTGRIGALCQESASMEELVNKMSEKGANRCLIRVRREPARGGERT